MSSMESIHWSSCNWMCLVCPIPSTYVGMPSPELGPAVLRWGNDMASLPPHNILRPDSAVWPWHPSSIWSFSGLPMVQLYSTVCKQLTSVNASHLVLEVCIRRYASLSALINCVNAYMWGWSGWLSKVEIGQMLSASFVLVSWLARKLGW